jgi:malate dehydrogenase (oxaloacetate-decarboxylating)
LAKDPVVFDLPNPIPETLSEETEHLVAVMERDKSDYPIRSITFFFRFFKVCLDCLAIDIKEEIKIASAYVIADYIEENHLQPEYIILSVFDDNVV